MTTIHAPEAATTMREGDIDVDGGSLHYRLSGPATAAHTVVLENGWSGSFPYMHWLEQALASQLRVLAYDRAGIGYSRSATPPSVAGISRHFESLLSALGIDTPVIVAGHSYGGLIGVLHAVQAPARVRALVQIDPTPDGDDALIDPSFKLVPAIARFMQLCALLGLDGPLSSTLARQLPAETMARLRPGRRWMLRSLEGAIAEIGLLQAIRGVIATSPQRSRCPRLVISSAPPETSPSWLQRRLGSPAKQQRFQQAAQAQHRLQAALHPDSLWTTQAYDHVGLIADRASANEVAGRVFAFLQQMPS